MKGALSKPTPANPKLQFVSNAMNRQPFGQRLIDRCQFDFDELPDLNVRR